MHSGYAVAVSEHVVDEQAQSRRSDVQGLRAVAVSAVVAFHAGAPISGGFTGVDVFFVISGFVITLMLSREWEQHGTIDLLAFYIRRFKRLAPALSLVVSTTMIAGLFLMSPIGSDVRVAGLTGIGAIFFCANVVIAKLSGGYFEPAVDVNPLLNTWSLSVEEQFYLVFPATFLAALVLGKRYWRLAAFVVIAAVGILSLAVCLQAFPKLLQFSDRVGISIGFYSPVARAWEFAAGSVLALMGSRFAIYRPCIAEITGATGLLLVMLSFFVINAKTPFPGPATLLPVVGAMLTIYSGSINGYRPLVFRLLSAPPGQYLGDMSYSWYLWHWPLIVFFTTAAGQGAVAMMAAVVLSILLARGSYLFVEDPLRRLPLAKSKAFLWRFFPVTVLPPVMLSLVLITINANGYWSEKIAAYQFTINTLHAGGPAQWCGDGWIPESMSDPKCQWNASGSAPPVYLIGDSNAFHLSEGVISAAIENDSPVHVLTRGGCSFIGRWWTGVVPETHNFSCAAFADGVISIISRSAPGTVIIGLTDSYFFSQEATGPNKETVSADPNVAFPYLESDLVSKIERLQTAHHRTIVVLPMPKFVDFDNQVLFTNSRCTMLGVLRDKCPANLTLPVEHVDFLQKNARKWLTRAAKKTGSSLVDLQPLFCNGGVCSTFGRQGSIFEGLGFLYVDAGHMNVPASTVLKPIFAPLLLKNSSAWQ